MSARYSRVLCVAWLLIVVQAGLAFASAGDGHADQGEKRVLVLYSLRQDAELSIEGNRALPRILADGLKDRVDFHVEYIDLARFPEPDYKAAFRDFLAIKYRQQPPDVVVAVLDNACQFIEENRDLLFPDAPVVFLSINARPRHLPNSTVVLTQVDLTKSLELAMALQPAIRDVFVVSGASPSDKAYEALARAQLHALEPRLAFTYLAGLPTGELVRRLATLPERSIVYFVLVNQDGAGEAVHPLEYLDRLSAIANAPVYSWAASAIGRGSIGGSLIQVDAQIDALAERTLRVLRGERADGIPAAAPNLAVNQIDWRQMQRWGISEARVPAGTQIKFREPGVWERYRFFIAGAAALVLLQTALIAGLLVQRSRRELAENKLRTSKADLNASYERIRDLGGRLLSAQEEERSRIARELHDDISQQVALLAMDLDLLLGSTRERSPGEQQAVAEQALDRVQGVSRSVHDLSHRLHPARLRLVGLVPALESLQRELSQPGIAITFHDNGVPPSLPQDVSLCLFRVVQEALNNAVKHSGARRVSVTARGKPGSLTMTVVDDGVGFDVQAAVGRGLGLISMTERIEGIGGTIKIESRPAGGTRLEVAVPYHADEQSARVAV